MQFFNRSNAVSILCLAKYPSVPHKFRCGALSCCLHHNQKCRNCWRTDYENRYMLLRFSPCEISMTERARVHLALGATEKHIYQLLMHTVSWESLSPLSDTSRIVKSSSLHGPSSRDDRWLSCDSRADHHLAKCSEFIRSGTFVSQRNEQVPFRLLWHGVHFINKCAYGHIQIDNARSRRGSLDLRAR